MPDAAARSPFWLQFVITRGHQRHYPFSTGPPPLPTPELLRLAALRSAHCCRPVCFHRPTLPPGFDFWLELARADLKEQVRAAALEAVPATSPRRRQHFCRRNSSPLHDNSSFREPTGSGLEGRFTNFPARDIRRVKNRTFVPTKRKVLSVLLLLVDENYRLLYGGADRRLVNASQARQGNAPARFQGQMAPRRLEGLMRAGGASSVTVTVRPGDVVPTVVMFFGARLKKAAARASTAMAPGASMVDLPLANTATRASWLR